MAPPPLNFEKIVATRCQILRLKCTRFDFGWGSALDPAGEAYNTPPDSLAGLKGDCVSLLFVHPDISKSKMLLLTNLENRIVGYSLVSRPWPIKWNAFRSGTS